jgi:hypothetical protein
MSTQQFIDAIYQNNLTTLTNMVNSDPSIIGQVNTNNGTLIQDILEMDTRCLCNNAKTGDQLVETRVLKFLVKSGITLPHSMNKLLEFARLFGSTDGLLASIYERLLDDQKQYYENLLQQKLAEQKEQLLEEMYAPKGIGYNAAKERFESNKN